MLSLNCPHCGANLQIPEKYAGQTGVCVKCNGKLSVPPLATSENKTPAVDLNEIEEQLNRNSSFDEPNVASTGVASQVVTVQCMHCRQPIDIDASVCPHCGKQTGISYQLMMAGGFVGTITGMIIQYFAVFGGGDSDADGFWSLMCTACVCNPLFYVFVVPGMILGILGGAVAAYFIKHNMKANAEV